MTTPDTGSPTAPPWQTDDFFAGIEPAERRRLETLDVHTAPGATGRRPAVVFVHGGPVPEGHSARDSAVFTGYGALAAAAGLAGITFDHPLHATIDHPRSADVLGAVLAHTRELDEVDPDHVALWCFSGGGALAADWLRASPPWLRMIAWTYPVLAPPPDRPGDRERFDCISAASAAPDLPKLLVRVGAEYPQLVATQAAFVASADSLEVVDLPGAAHGFETQGYDGEARQGVGRAMSRVAGALREPAGAR
jgi:acetyl esterase/lipase